MEKVLGGIMFFFTIVFSFGCDNKELNGNQLMDEAWRLFKEGHFKQTIDFANQSIFIDSSNEYAYLLKGLSYDMLNDKGSALETYKNTLRVNSQSPLANFSIGIDFWVNGYLDSSLVYYEKALTGKLDSNVNMYFDITRNKFTSMVDRLLPSSYEIRHFRALAYYDMGDDENALIDFEYSLDGKYDIGESSYYLGKIYLERGRRQKACHYFSQAFSAGYDIPDGIKANVKKCL